MSSSQVAVLALDAADYRLVKEWGIDEFLLDRHQSLETAAGEYDQPATDEVWPTVATGLTFEEHGLGHNTTSRWGNPFIETASRIAEPLLSKELRNDLGSWLLRRGASLHESNEKGNFPHPFDSLYQWPGLTEATHLQNARQVYHETKAGGIPIVDLRRRLYRLAADECAWIAASPGLVGTHCHTLDCAGHFFCDDEHRLKKWYKDIAQFTAALRAIVDELIILSDHGMQVEWLDDPIPGDHSWHSMISVTEGIDGPLPSSIFDVYEFLRSLDVESPGESTIVPATSLEQLEHLGYLPEDSS